MLAFTVDDLMERWWVGDLVLEKLMWEVGKAEYYSNVRVMQRLACINVPGCGLSAARRSRSSFLRFRFVSATMVVCNSSRASCTGLQHMFADLHGKKRTIHQLQTALSSARLRL